MRGVDRRHSSESVTANSEVSHLGVQNRVAPIRIAADLLFRDVTGKSIWKEKGHEERIALRNN